jgi:diaminohydroxyphosphoribosylaminopyrimidine deaminase/5-amino-6-(5-phosphoribosylamino)uracil reductase
MSTVVERPPDGCGTFICKEDSGRVDVHGALAKMAGQGINTVFAEGGAHVARALIKADLVDRLILIRAPMTLGERGLDAFAGLSVASVLTRFTLLEQEKLGPDILTVYEKRA